MTQVIVGGALLLGLLVGLATLLSHAQEQDKIAFMSRCTAAQFTPDQCGVLYEVKRSGDDAQMLGAAAIGMAASR